MARKNQPIGLCSLVAILLLFSSAASAAGEDELEYQMDFGAALGTSFYLGDANSAPFAHLGGMGGFTARRILNPRMAVKGNLLMGHISGTSDGYFIPTDPWNQGAEGGIPTTVSFSRNLIDFGAQFEMNFWGFGMDSGYKENSRITPYALAGMGFTLALGGAGTKMGMNLPIGVGVKYKVRPRLNVGLEWTMRFSTCDDLDVSSKEHMQLDHPYGIESVGLKNKDCYSFTMVFVTYDMCPKYRKCNND